jgi:phosphoglycerol transferase
MTGILFTLFVGDTSGQIKMQPETYRQDFYTERDFVGRNEKLVPEGASILQLLSIENPERAPIGNEDSYGMMRGYIHSKTIRWSYEGMKGRPGDVWHRALSNLPINKQVAVAQQSGFEGIYIERRAFADHGVRLEGMLEKFWDHLI